MDKLIADANKQVRFLFLLLFVVYYGFFDFHSALSDIVVAKGLISSKSWVFNIFFSGNHIVDVFQTPICVFSSNKNAILLLFSVFVVIAQYLASYYFLN